MGHGLSPAVLTVGRMLLYFSVFICVWMCAREYARERGGLKKKKKNLKIIQHRCVYIKCVIECKETKKKKKARMCPVCMHVCRARAYVAYVHVLNQYLHLACRLSWVSQFDRVFFFFFWVPHVDDVCKSIHVQFVCKRQNGETSKLICSSILLDPATGS